MSKPEGVNERVWLCACELMGGEHHFPKGVDRLPGGGLELRIFQNFASYDGGMLTYAVLLSHKYFVRISLDSCTWSMMRLQFHPRENNPDGCNYDRHPSLSDLSARIDRMPKYDWKEGEE